MTEPQSVDQPDRQTTGDVTPDPGGWIAYSLLGAIVLLVSLYALALIISVA